MRLWITLSVLVAPSLLCAALILLEAQAPAKQEEHVAIRREVLNDFHRQDFPGHVFSAILDSSPPHAEPVLQRNVNHVYVGRG